MSRSREVREQTRRQFIANAIDILNRSLDYQRTLASLAWIAVPTIADGCAVDIVENGKLQRLAVAHVDPKKIDLIRELERRHFEDVDSPSGVPHVLRTGQPEMLAVITPSTIQTGTTDPVYRAKVVELGVCSYIGAPLKRGDHTFGVITLLMGESGRHYDEEDLSLATTLADRASIAIENARLFRELETAHARTAVERDRLIQLVASAPVAIAILRGPELVFEVTNELFDQTFGGRKLQGLRQANIDPTGQNGDDLREVLRTGKRIYHHELETTYDWAGTGSPTTRTFEVAMAPMRDAQGRVDGVMTFSIDITEQVQSRKRLEEARLLAESANRAKDEFLAMLGHELRNPLAPILTALELMELRAPEAFQRERTVIARQVRHVVRLVDDLLDVSRITRGALELHREDLDIADVIAKAIEMASPILEERIHRLETQIARGLLVHGDPVRLAQVVANLVTNAAKYTERGGTITITASLDDGRVGIHVRDTGVGIDPEVLPHVFETFYQGRQALDRAKGGLGLGLAIVKSLVALHEGTVEARSDGLGSGSEFTVWLPAVEVPAQPVQSTRAHGARPRAEKILVVDDNPDALDMLADALEQRGFPTYRAHDAPSALALASQVHPAIALLDIGLPVMDGYELGRRLRETTGLEEVQLIAVTGYGQPSDREKSREAGFAAHLVKPISVDLVQATIERLANHG